MVLKCFKQLFCHVDLTLTKLAQRVAMHPTVHVATPMPCAINALPFPAWHGTLSPSTMKNYRLKGQLRSDHTPTASFEAQKNGVATFTSPPNKDF